MNHWLSHLPCQAIIAPMLYDNTQHSYLLIFLQKILKFFTRKGNFVQIIESLEHQLVSKTNS